MRFHSTVRPTLPGFRRADDGDSFGREEDVERLSFAPDDRLSFRFAVRRFGGGRSWIRLTHVSPPIL